MNKHENLFIIMIEIISNSEQILPIVPIHIFMSKFLQGFLIKFIPSNNGNVWADLSFKIDDPSKA